MASAELSYECPICLRVTHHPEDVANSCCPCCGSVVLPRQCEHPRLYETPVSGPPGGRSQWLLYRSLCPHGYLAQQVVRPPDSAIPPDVQVAAIIENHHRTHECRCLDPVLARYRKRLGAPPSEPDDRRN